MIQEREIILGSFEESSYIYKTTPWDDIPVDSIRVLSTPGCELGSVWTHTPKAGPLATFGPIFQLDLQPKQELLQQQCQWKHQWSR